MPITLVTGPANAGKAQVVLDDVRRELARESAPLLVVPTRADAESYLRELAGDGAAMGVRVERFSGLIREVAARAGIDGRLVGEITRERVIADALQYAGFEHPAAGLVRAAGALIAQLRARRVTPARFAAALARHAQINGGPASGAIDLGAMLSRYDRRLARIGRMDSEQHAALSLDALRRRPSLWGGSPVLFYGFDDFTDLQIDAIETLGRVVDAPVTVSLTFERARAAFAGRAATFQALAPLAARHVELAARDEHYAPAARDALSHLERTLLEPCGAPIGAAAAVRLLEGGGERAEIELVAEHIARLIADGMRPHDIAIAARSPDQIADLLHEVLSAAGLPHALERRVPFGHTAVGRALIGLLRCCGEDGELGDLLAWLRAPGEVERVELIDELEIEARRTGAASASAARALWEKRGWPLERIDRLHEASRRGAPALLDRAASELERLFVAPRRGRGAVLDGDEATEARAVVAARAAMSELRELARGAPDIGELDADALARLLEGIDVAAGERPGRGLVTVADPLALRARRVRALFLVSMQEGVFPARSRPDPLLADEQRRGLAQASGLIVGHARDALADERYLLYAAVSRPQELLVVSWHAAGDDGEPQSRSLFVDDILDLFDGALPAACERRALGQAPDVGRAPERGPLGAREIHDERVLAHLRAQVWSPSSLESWISCPVRWFVERMLRPGEIDPEAEPLARGALAHAALHDVLEALREERASARLTPAALPRARALLREALARHQERITLSVSPERAIAARRSLLADLDRYIAEACAAQSPLEPQLLELGFGFAEKEGEPPSGALDLGGGVMVRGRVDRVDVAEDGAAVVYDYKSKVAPRPSSWLSDGKVQIALYMAAVEQAAGLRVAGGFYQPLSGEDLRPRGVLDSGSGITLDGVRGDAREGQEMHALLDEVLDLARRAAAEARAGALEPRPDTCAFRGGCMFPAICRCGR